MGEPRFSKYREIPYILLHDGKWPIYQGLGYNRGEPLVPLTPLLTTLEL